MLVLVYGGCVLDVCVLIECVFGRCVLWGEERGPLLDVVGGEGFETLSGATSFKLEPLGILRKLGIAFSCIWLFGLGRPVLLGNAGKLCMRWKPCGTYDASENLLSCVLVGEGGWAGPGEGGRTVMDTLLERCGPPSGNLLFALE